MGTINSILQSAQQRAKEMQLPYEGALSPTEAYDLLHAAPGAKLVDVRSRAELDWVGRIPDSVDIEWASYPGMKSNPHFITQLEQQVEKEALVMFICRSGARSHHAATLAKQAGYASCYNILEGFEGDMNNDQQRNVINGWRAAGLPWVQV